MITWAMAHGPSWLTETSTLQDEEGPSDFSHAAATCPCNAIEGRFHSSLGDLDLAPVDGVAPDKGRSTEEGARPGLDESFLCGPQAARVAGHGLLEAGGTGLSTGGGGCAGADPAASLGVSTPARKADPGSLT